MIEIVKKKINLIIPTFVFSFIPLLTFAQGTATSVVQAVTQSIGRLIPVVIGLGLLVFLWGIIKYMTSDSSEGKAEAIKYITNGLIALLVMVAVWGFVSLVASFVFGGNGSNYTLQGR